MRRELPAPHEWSVISEPNGFRVETAAQTWLREVTEIVRARLPHVPMFELVEGE